MPELTFLNLTANPKGWNDASLDMLWRYNLHYFDKAHELIPRWIAENPKGSAPGWDPYPTSLRIVNWAKAIAAGTLARKTVEASLADQVDWLASHLEYHILANHYLANLKAMVIGNVALGRDCAKWLARYRAQIAEQVLEDGGHYERSPMYHAIILEDVLDVIRFCGDDARDLRPVTAKMLRYLVAMTGPDGKIAMFNDAADGIAKPTDWIVSYAASLGVAPAEGSQDASLQDFPETGYARLACGDFVLYVDAAPIGPDYQPGHAHADTLTYELYWKGRKVVADAGTSEYRGARRAFERSSRAHNVVVVDGRDSSEVWSSHRVGRRARIVRRVPQANAFEAEYVSRGLRVVRRWELTADALTVTERISGGSSADTRIHFAAGMQDALRVCAPSGATPAFEPYERAIEFGKVEKAVCCRMAFDPRREFSYRLEVKP